MTILQKLYKYPLALLACVLVFVVIGPAAGGNVLLLYFPFVMFVYLAGAIPSAIAGTIFGILFLALHDRIERERLPGVAIGAIIGALAGAFAMYGFIGRLAVDLAHSMMSNNRFGISSQWSILIFAMCGAIGGAVSGILAKKAMLSVLKEPVVYHDAIDLPTAAHSAEHPSSKKSQRQINLFRFLAIAPLVCATAAAMFYPSLLMVSFYFIGIFGLLSIGMMVFPWLALLWNRKESQGVGVILLSTASLFVVGIGSSLVTNLISPPLAGQKASGIFAALGVGSSLILLSNSGLIMLLGWWHLNVRGAQGNARRVPSYWWLSLNWLLSCAAIYAVYANMKPGAMNAVTTARDSKAQQKVVKQATVENPFSRGFCSDDLGKARLALEQPDAMRDVADIRFAITCLNRLYKPQIPPERVRLLFDVIIAHEKLVGIDSKAGCTEFQILLLRNFYSPRPDEAGLLLFKHNGLKVNCLTMGFPIGAAQGRLQPIWFPVINYQITIHDLEFLQSLGINLKEVDAKNETFFNAWTADDFSGDVLLYLMDKGFDLPNNGLAFIVMKRRFGYIDGKTTPADLAKLLQRVGEPSRDELMEATRKGFIAVIVERGRYSDANQAALITYIHARIGDFETDKLLEDPKHMMGAATRAVLEKIGASMAAKKASQQSR